MEKVNLTQLFLQRKTDKLISKILLFPITRIIIALIFLFPIIMAHNLFVEYVLSRTEELLYSILFFVETSIFLALLFIAYHLYTKYIEGRKAFEFKMTNWLNEYGKGTAIGGGMVIFITFVLFVFGFYEIEKFNSPFILVTRIFRYGVATFIEELIFTVIIFRLIEEFLGTVTSIIIVSLLFGLMHLGNDHATLLSSFFISLEHLVLLAPFILTRRIWMVWAIHFSWNFLQTAVLGMNNSGMEHGGFITPVITGPEWLTGGSFGIEGSYLSILVNIIAGIIILLIAVKNLQLTKAMWKRVKTQ